MIQRAIQALRAFGAYDRETASKMLIIWAHSKELTAEQREKVIEAF